MVRLSTNMSPFDAEFSFTPSPQRQLSLQRHFESFPFFEFFKAAFTMGLIGLVVALLMIVHAFQNVGRFPLRIRQTPFD